MMVVTGSQMKMGIIDLGSNSIRLVVYHWDGQDLKVIHNIKKISKNIQYVHDFVMSKEGLEAILHPLKELMILSRAYDVETLHIFATASLRNIKNSLEAKSYLEQAIAHPIDLLDGKEESLLGFEGLKRVTELPLEGISVDIGGGSTEITYFKHGEVVALGSIPLGSLNLYLNHVHDVLPSSSEEFMMRVEIQKYLHAFAWLKEVNVNTVLGIGGTARAILRLHQAKYSINTSIYDMTLSHNLLHTYTTHPMKVSDEETKLIFEALPDRFTTVIPGCIVMDEIMQIVKASEYRISSYGVREGYLYSKVLPKV